MFAISSSEAPISILMEEIKCFCDTALDKGSLPFWLTKEQVIEQSIDSIVGLLKHIQQHGNTWPASDLVEQ